MPSAGHSLWEASLEAERDGRIAEALQFQEQLMEAGDISSAACFRLAWLYFLAGNDTCASRFYDRAMNSLAPETGPVQ